MGRKIHDRYPAAEAAFKRAEAVLRMPVRQLCFEGPEEELNRTDVLQPCVMTCSWAAYEVWRESHGMGQVKVMAGHSLGEFTALAAAGALSWEAALLLVKERGEIMSRAAVERPGAMIAIVDLDQAKIEEIITEAGKSGKLYMANRERHGPVRALRRGAGGAGGGAPRSRSRGPPSPDPDHSARRALTPDGKGRSRIQEGGRPARHHRTGHPDPRQRDREPDPHRGRAAK